MPDFAIASAGMDVLRPARSHRRRVAVAVLAGATVCLGSLFLSRLRAAPPTVDPRSAWIDVVKRGALRLEVQGQGTLVPENVLWISAQVPARVERILHTPGAVVKADTVLVKLSNPQVEIQALEAEGQVVTGRSQLANIAASLEAQRLAEEAVIATLRSQLGETRRQAAADEALAQKGALSELERGRSRERASDLSVQLEFEIRRLESLDRGMRAQIAAQRAHVEQLASFARFRQRELQALEVRAGIDGVLQELPLEPGQTVAVGATIARVAQPVPLKAELRIAETQAKDLVLGQRASVDTHDGVVPGRVVRIDPAAQSGTVKVDVAIDGPLPGGARPDLGVDGVIEFERLPDVLYVGRPALGAAQSTITLFRVDRRDGASAVRTAVRLGRSSARVVQILDGLEEGDRVILSDTTQWDRADRIRLH